MYIFVVYIQQCLDYSFKMTHMYRLLDGWLFISIFACIYTTLVYQRYVQLHEGVSVSFGQVRSDSWNCGRGKLIRGWGGQIKKESTKIGRTERKIQKRQIESLSSAEHGKNSFVSSIETIDRGQIEANRIGWETQDITEEWAMRELLIC